MTSCKLKTIQKLRFKKSKLPFLYRPHFFYYEVVILLQRMGLAGFLLLLPDSALYMRVQVRLKVVLGYESSTSWLPTNW